MTAPRRPRVPPRTTGGATRTRACVLAVGGLDPGGGAGILADARAVVRAGAFPCAAVAVLTVQSTSGLRRASPVPRADVLAACREVLAHQHVRAIKVGALGSAENTRAIAGLLARHEDVPSVVDTVMIPTRGRARLLEERAVSAMRDRVLPNATLVTCNAPEAEALTGLRVRDVGEAHDAALALLRLGARGVLVKGGHLGGRDAVDLLALAPPRGAAGQAHAHVVELAAPRLRVRPFHGGGCVLASLVAGRLACRAEAYAADGHRAVMEAVRWAKQVHHEALGNASDVGGVLRVLL